MSKRSGVIAHLAITLRGIGMGAADVVPGVSGGTIAFISGIYDELLSTISSFNLGALKTLRKEGLKAFWQHINGSFLVALFIGIGISVATLGSLISGILEEEGESASKIKLWSFFFGLIVASVIYIGKQVKQWKLGEIVGIISGTIVAYYVTIAPISEGSDSLIFLFFAGMLAICAMILPGISGSFILVLLGAYKPVMGAIKNVTAGLKGDTELLVEGLLTVGVVGIGCVIGLLSFSRVLSFLLKRFESITLAALTGFMIGSLNKIWPWKEVLDTRTNSEGHIVPTRTGNLLPTSYEQMYNMDSSLLMAIIFAVAGFALVFGLEFLGEKMKKYEN
jgi:putative membrane protein